jgi:hypothetical protein
MPSSEDVDSSSSRMGGAASSAAGDGEALALAAGEHHAALADRCVDAERVALDDLAEVHRLQHALAILIGCRGRGESEVVGDRPRQGGCVLLDIAELRAQVVAVEGADVPAHRRGSRPRSGRRSAR